MRLAVPLVSAGASTTCKSRPNLYLRRSRSPLAYGLHTSGGTGGFHPLRLSGPPRRLPSRFLSPPFTLSLTLTSHPLLVLTLTSHPFLALTLISHSFFGPHSDFSTSLALHSDLSPFPGPHSDLSPFLGSHSNFSPFPDPHSDFSLFFGPHRLLALTLTSHRLLALTDLSASLGSHSDLLPFLGPHSDHTDLSPCPLPSCSLVDCRCGTLVVKVLRLDKHRPFSLMSRERGMQYDTSTTLSLTNFFFSSNLYCCNSENINPFF